MDKSGWNISYIYLPTSIEEVLNGAAVSMDVMLDGSSWLDKIVEPAATLDTPLGIAVTLGESVVSSVAETNELGITEVSLGIAGRVESGDIALLVGLNVDDNSAVREGTLERTVLIAVIVAELVSKRVTFVSLKGS